MRTTASLGSSWFYLPRFEEAFLDPGLALDAWTRIDLPHANLELPYNAFDERSYQFVSTYARDLELPDLCGPGGEGGGRAFLDFEGVMAACDLWVNGKPAGGHRGGYTPFSIEITGLARPGRNRILLRVDSTERDDIPPFGHVIDYLCYGGVYRGAYLRTTSQAYISDLFAKPLVVGGDKSLEAEVEIDCLGRDQGGSGSLSLGGLELGFSLAGRDGKVLGEARVKVGADASARLSMTGLGAARLWDLDGPELYELEARLLSGGVEVDRAKRRVGFRTAEWKPEGFFLNGRLVKLRGLNRHQAWPYSGYAMPARAQAKDAEILKRDLGLNLVRTSHYPQAPAFLDACDELGLLVFEELPGWQHIGDAAWKDLACQNLAEMIRRDRSRPSIILWGARINESQDDHDFYVRTNEIAHRLDPTRATGGVRCIERSELLEDVYTMNDFNHNGARPPLRKERAITGLSRDVPYLVTEHNGHMYPTKRFDNEERLREHALRHARVLDAGLSTPGVAGAIGWCAFDYNTHKDFGSGDRICYHGVSDMFRLPKYAAALYASQKSPGEGLVLETASLFTKGERSAALVLPIEVYTNCDEICLYRAGKTVGRFFPDSRAYPGLPHPPIVIGDLIGDQLAGTRLRPRDQALMKRIVGKILSEGYENLGFGDKIDIGLLLLRNRMTMAEGTEIFNKFGLGWGEKDESWEIVGFVAGKEAVRRSYGGDAVPARLALVADDSKLSRDGVEYGEGWDSTRLTLSLLDQYGNISPFAAECVEIEVEGPGRALGPSRIPLIGGCMAFWVRTTAAPGDEIRVRARGTRFASETVTIRVEG